MSSNNDVLKDNIVENLRYIQLYLNKIQMIHDTYFTSGLINPNTNTLGEIEHLERRLKFLVDDLEMDTHMINSIPSYYNHDKS